MALDDVIRSVVANILETHQGGSNALEIIDFCLLATSGLLATSQASAQVPQSYAFTDLVGLTEGNSMASAVNNAGDVVGQSNFTDTGRGYRATVWHGTTPTELPYAASGRSGASDINNGGEIVGTELFGFPTEWKGTEVTTLPTLASRALGGRGFANAINDRGQVAGEAYLPSPSQGSRAVVWNGTKLTELDALGPAQGGVNEAPKPQGDKIALWLF